jgi:hypothetical protein
MKNIFAPLHRRPAFHRYYTLSKLALICSTPIILLLLPATFFDTGESICLSQVLLKQNCFACGMTRACQHLIHLDFENAFAYNMMSFVAFPALSIVWVQWFFKELRTWKRIRNKRVDLAL